MKDVEHYHASEAWIATVERWHEKWSDQLTLFQRLELRMMLALTHAHLANARCARRAGAVANDD